MTDAGAIIAAAILGGTATILSAAFGVLVTVDRRKRNNRTTTTTLTQTGSTHGPSADTTMIPGLAEICQRHAAAWAELRQMVSAQETRQDTVEALLTEVRSDVKEIYKYARNWNSKNGEAK